MRITRITASCLLMSFFNYSGVKAQTTQTFQPNAAEGKDAMLFDCIPCGFHSTNYGTRDELSAIAWTYSQNVSDARGLLEFDLTSIPSNATVTDARLSLYFNPDPASGNMGSHHSTLSGPNNFYLKKVTQSWDENTVTWDSQPATTTTGQVSLPATISNTENYPNMNVTALVQDMVSNPSQNFGFMLELADENYYRGVLFASSDHSNAALHPKLVVTYTLDTPCNSPDLPSIGGNTTLCNNAHTTLSIASGSLNDATNWYWYTGSCGGTLVGVGNSLTVSSPGTYFVRGEGGCVSSGSCQSVAVDQQNVSASVFLSGNSNLIAGNANGYQWLNCQAAMSPLPGDTYQVFEPQSDGYYAVVETVGTCSDTSQCFHFTSSSSGDSCITFRPDGDKGKDATIGDCVACGFYWENYGTYDEFSAIAWTREGNESDLRGLLAFDIGSIPDGAMVTEARLSLYENPDPATGNMNGLHSTASGSNAAYLKRIVENWDENTVTWANQPATSASGQVLLPASTSGTENYIDIDVTDMIQEMVDDPSHNFGFMLQLLNETHYRGLIFASSDHPNANLHPKLEVCYSSPTAGIAELSSAKDMLTVSPNPGRDNFRISVPEEVSNGMLYIIDATGNVVYKDVFSGDQQLLNPLLSAGLYMLKLINGDHFYTGRIIIG